MSCNGCRVLRKGCSDTCTLRSCLHWIDSPESQGHATLFLARFFGRSDLMAFISSVSESKRPALFQSLLFEACGRTVNPVNGAVGLLWSGNWHVCQAAVETVFSGGFPRPLPEIISTPILNESTEPFYQQSWPIMVREMNLFDLSLTRNHMRGGSVRKSPTTSFASKESEMTKETKKLLNLFV
ncbi:putative LOB domain-containing protein [Quillaja saponaria]|uniref:LOB domain-containing protein n=1 Tax=Quillaja saponaria TaxID=32244 RepID=A0AAD7LZW1_QUISA|nr:putative LOB domain-containing protein [Quillaja saponaria]